MRDLLRLPHNTSHQTPVLGLTLAALIVATSATATAASPEPVSALPDPYGPAVNGDIAFARDGDIWVADPRGGAAHALIAGPETDAWPAFSRDGSRLMFERREAGSPPRLMIAAADGSDPVPFTDIPGDFPWSDWSPDGVHFAAEWVIDGQLALQVLTTDGSAPPRTLELGEVVPLDLAGFRPPDGREIVFTGHATAGSEEVGMYAIGIDGTGLRTIGATDTDGGSFGDPALSPDGSAVTYWNWEPDFRAVSNLYQRDLTTGATTALSLDPTWPWGGVRPRYTPDGASLVFESIPHEDGADLHSQLVIAPLDGSVPATPLGSAYGGDDAGSYDISPDGTIVLFDLAGASWMIDATTGVATETQEYLPDQPSWQRR